MGSLIPSVLVGVLVPGQHPAGVGQREAVPSQRRAKHAKYALHFLRAASILEWKIGPDFLGFGGFMLASFPHSHFTSSRIY